MSRLHRPIQLWIVGMTFLGLLVGVYLFACKRSEKPDPSDPIIKHPVETSPDDALKYWSEEKMRNAKPAKLLNVDALDPEKEKQHPPHTSRPNHA